jgi:hypothetical protein
LIATPGVQVGFAGPSDVQILAPTNNGEPALAMRFGRMFAGTAGVAGAGIYLELGGHRGMATFADATSEAAIEVRPYLPPGQNPEQDGVVQLVVHIFVLSGRVEWQDLDSGVMTPISANQVRIAVGDRVQTIAVNQSPAWVQREGLSAVDRMASSDLETSIAPDRPIGLALNESTMDRKSEVRSLAARCMAYLQSYDALLDRLRKDPQRAYWASEFDTLREVLALSQASARSLRETIERMCGEDAVAAYRMLWGFSPQQLQAGDDQRLVEFLEHDSMIIRVLAFENLRRITGKTLSYRPDVTEVRRKSAVRDWQDLLEAGAIIYQSLPSP